MVTRIALVDLPGLLSEVVLEAFSEQPDVDVQVLPAGTGPQRILADHPDVVFVGASDPQHYMPAEQLLSVRPDLGLFAISPDGRQAWIYELHPRSRRLAEVSISSLRDAVRAVVKGRQP